jgi:hypothetical protein
MAWANLLSLTLAALETHLFMKENRWVCRAIAGHKNEQVGANPLKNYILDLWTSVISLA